MSAAPMPVSATSSAQKRPLLFFFFNQKTAYEISTRDWSSDVCSSDLADHAVPADHFEARQRFRHRRDIGNRREPLRRGDRDRSQLASSHLRLRTLQAGEGELIAAADEIDERRPAALVGDVLRLHAGHLLVELARE